ncbi:EDD domain protein, DegV family [Carnobacterium iners]|uniref:EDD domain protein, DegV family n=1 Tax=Carnobacterium iners TaxID=1073423 RepID=A0A1X7MY61_9LACT|nr:DegV family protein [Carnobacterium iners]SEK18826.1 EDD domain protein, DegV family [Carnobacterium iners]SMH29760.1 EDD domain protein, DegV family [Carnobacterium iners]
MIKYIITTESGSDISPQLAERYGIYVVPMHVTMGSETYDDGSFDVEDIYRFYDKTGTLPKTSGSTPQDFTTVFERIFEEHPGAHIIHVAYSAVTTVSYNSCVIAARELENIHVIDSKNVSGGLTAVVVATAKFVEANPDSTPEEIVAFVEEVRERTRFVFLPQSLLYLKAGGRVSNVAYLGASLLRLHPTIIIENGYLVASKKYRGSYERCLKNAVKDFVTNYSIDPETLTIGGTAGLSQAYKQLGEVTLNKLGYQDPLWFSAGAVISSHGGPGAFGIIGIEKK